ncbi:MAG: cytochrome c oxidase subunit II [Ignavibacteria bacterium]|nr:cytochrome c oxidase subunit II [Ignavibacteria bacterium]
MFQTATNYAQKVDYVMLYIIGISFILLLIITISMIYFVIKYNRKKHPIASQIEGNKTIEIIWIVVPVVLVLTMFFYSYGVFKEARIVPPGALNVKVEAKMWAWKFYYENGKVTDTLFIPAGKPVKFTIVATDVNHSFYIPAFRIKEDAVPGRENYMVVHPKEIGSFDIACAEYCGMNHSIMYTKVYVVPEKEFSEWLQGKVDENYLRRYVASHTGGYKDYLTGSYAILFAKGCVQCHNIDNRKGIGPSFVELQRGFANVKINGKDTAVVIDKNYIRESIINPNLHIVKGYEKISMPSSVNILKEDELNYIVDLLYSNFVKNKQ